MTRPIVPATEASDARAVGGKAASLAVLARAGFDVPPFVVLPPQAFGPDGLTGEAGAGLAAALDRLGPGPFAVRSSGREEDGADHSHAGQFLSRLDVAAADVAAAALDVWRSGASDTLAAYRAARGLDAKGAAPGSGLGPDGGAHAHAPAVMVQRMVRARAAGVAFSADPVSGRRDLMLVSAIAGLGDRLVGGEVDGDDYVLDSATSAVRQRPAGGGVLSDADLAALAGLIRRVEASQGRPQDIEWAFAGERLYLLQARPITTALRPAPLADATVTIFDNSNIVESYPGLVSPLTYSFAQYVYARVYRSFVALVGVDAASIRASGAVFENMLGRIDGRVYYNLVNWYRALALLPGFRLNRAHMETMMGVDVPLPAEITAGIGPPPAKGVARLAEYARLARVGLRLAFEAARLKATIRAFEARLNRAVQTGPDQLAAMPLSALAGEYRAIEADLLERWDAPLVNDFLCMLAFGASRRLLQNWCGAAGLELHNSVMIGQGDIVSAEPAQRIARMGRLAAARPDVIAALRQAAASPDPAAGLAGAALPPQLAEELASYIAKFGDRCTEELKLESITLGDDPAPLLMAVAAAAEAGRPAPVKAAGASPAQQLAALLRGNPLKFYLARAVLGWAKNRVRDRENLRFDRTRLFGHARRVFLAMAEQFAAHGLIDAPRDIFLLSVAEVLGAIEGFGISADLKGLVAARRAEMARAAERPDPPARLTLDGAVARSAFALAGEGSGGGNGSRQGTGQAAALSGPSRQGTGCSAGLVRAKARVVRDPRREALAQGDILVARHTDPGWIAVFSNASAIVVERGSLLSHSAIVAREMGIPCVVGLKGALDWIADGERIEVDGASGIVRKVDG